MLLLAETLVVFTNTLLEVTPFMMTLSTVTMLFLVFGIVSLGIGFGAIYPNFRFENIAQVSTGFGGVIFMILSALFIAAVIVLEAGPVYLLFMADVRGTAISPMQWFFIALSFMAVLVVNGVATYVPLRIGIKALETKEI
jgi:ABC-2 type transport system permease protein